MNVQGIVFGLMVGIPLLSLSTLQQCEGDDDDDTPAAPLYDLADDVQVQYDTYGIPHIYGTNLNDVAFAQGYVTARDRLWHMDYLRRQAYGTLAEILGESKYSSDLYVRLFRFRDWAEDAYAGFQVDRPDVAEMLDAYSAGVNAYLADALNGENGASLPPQIVNIGYIPDEWTPIDSLVIDKSLAYGSSAEHSTEMTVWIISMLLGPTLTEDLLRPQPAGRTYIVPDFYDGVGDETPPEEGKATIRRTGGETWVPPGPLERERLLKALETIQRNDFLPQLSGSNSWVISGAYTESGFPILANDTHQGVEHPATYYEVHLNTTEAGGDVDMIGHGYPGMPLILFGHNQDIAWGLTLNKADVSDVFSETYVAGAVLHDGEMVPVERRTETIYVRPDQGAVSDAEAREVELEWVPHHGPIFPPEIVGDLPAVLSAGWTGYNGSSYLDVLSRLTSAHTFEDVQEGMTHLVAGAVNVVYADVNGNIGYSQRVDIPIRARLDEDNPPYMVVPGDGSYDFTGEILPDDLIPWTKNPAAGYVATSNNAPADLLDDNDALNGPYVEEIGSTIYLGAIYDIGHRAERIAELIEGALPQGGIRADDVMRWQADNQSVLARRYLPYLFDAETKREELVTSSMADALDILHAFAEDDYRCRDDSTGCVVFHAWLVYLLRDLFEDETDPSLFSSLSGTYLQIWCRPAIYFLDETAPIIDDLDFQASGGCKSDPLNPSCQVRFPSVNGHNYFDDIQTEDTIETRDEILMKALSQAVDNLLERGPLDSRTWSELHQIQFTDPAATGGYYTEVQLGPYPLDSGIFSVDVADGTLSSGGEFKSSIDVGNAPSQRTVYELIPGGIQVHDVLPGGQSERVDADHYADQLDLYLSNHVRDLPFYRGEVEAATTARLNLPAGYPDSGPPVWE